MTTRYAVVQDATIHGKGINLIRLRDSEDRATSDAAVMRRIEPYPVYVLSRTEPGQPWTVVDDPDFAMFHNLDETAIRELIKALADSDV